MATLSILPFVSGFTEDYHSIEEDFLDEEAVENYYQNFAKEQFSKWIK